VSAEAEAARAEGVELAHDLLGSIPYKLLHRSRVPVLVVPDGGE
jgi:hypothetical protein